MVTVDPPAAAGQRGRRHAVIFASSILTLPQTIGYGLRDNRYFSPLIKALAGRAAVTRCCTRSGSFSSPTSTCRSCSTQPRLPTTCGVRRVHPGIRPGKRTADYITNAHPHHAGGCVLLIIISFIPEWMITGIHLNHLPCGWWRAV